MASAFPTQNNSNWLKIDQNYNGKTVDADMFFDPQTLEITQNEFKPVPLPDDDFTPFLEKFNDIDNMLNETLGFQDLNIPSGYQQQQEYFDQSGLSGNDGSKKHSRKISGSAIFGFLNRHSHQLSIPGIITSESTYKKMNELIDYYNSNNLAQFNGQDIILEKKKSEVAPLQHKRSIEIHQEAHDDFIITGKNPVAFKFPQNTPSLDEQNWKQKNTNFDVDHQRNEQQFLKQNQKLNSSRDPPVNLPSDFFEIPTFSSNNSYSVDYINKLQQLSKSQSFKNLEFQDDDLTDEENPFFSLEPINKPNESEGMLKDQKNGFYILPPQDIMGKSIAEMSQTKLVYTPPEESFSSPKNSPIIPSNMFVSPQRNPPQLPDLQTPQKLKLPPAPKLQPASLSTPTKLAIGIKDDLTDSYLQYDERSFGTETPKKQLTSDTEQVFWTPILVTKKDPSSTKIIKDQRKKKVVSPKRKETKITSTLPKGHLEQYFTGPDESDRFTCTFNQCGKKFTRISNTRAHIQTHLSDRPYSCERCDKRFVRNHDLRRHQRSHQEFSFVCPCGKKFPRQDALKRHRIRKICCGAIEDDRPVSPDKKFITKPLKKKGKPKKEDELQEGLKDKLLEDLNNNAEDLDFGYLQGSTDLDKTGDFMLNGIRSNDDLRNFGLESTDVFDDFGYNGYNGFNV